MTRQAAGNHDPRGSVRGAQLQANRTPGAGKALSPGPAGQTEPDTTPVEVTVTARLGVVSTTTVLRM